MMSRRIKNNAETLTFLGRAKPNTAKAIIKTADCGLVNSLCECALNILHGNVPLSTKHRKRLMKHKDHMRVLVKGNISNQKKKQILQKGGFLSALLPPIIGILGSLFNR